MLVTIGVWSPTVQEVQLHSVLDSLLVSIHVISLFNVTLYCFSFSVPELPELVNELQDVSDWIPFDLYLGIKMPKLESVKVDCQTL